MDTMPTGPFCSGFRCVVCGKFFPPDYTGFICPDHGQEGILDVLYDYEAARPFLTPNWLQTQKKDMWRYRSLLPLPLSAPVPPLHVGWTPVYEAPRLAKQAGVQRLFIKDDSRNPTASFKDRASALAVACAKERNAPAVATASTGNAAAALAGMAAAMELPCFIFVPASAPSAKLVQLLAYGAHVFTVQGTYDEAFDICLEACTHMGWYNRNTAYNPCMAEGKKTAAYEFAEQLHWQIPDALFVSVGDGCILSGLHKGFVELQTLGLLKRIPRLYGVQAAGSDFMVQAAERGENVLTKRPISTHTVADSIAAGLPRDRVKALRAVTETGGAWIRVSDEAILAAIPELARLCGVFAEPAAAAAWAGILEAAGLGLLHSRDTVGMICTGSGLKDTQSALQACAMQHPFVILPGAEGLNSALRTVQTSCIPVK